MGYSLDHWGSWYSLLIEEERLWNLHWGPSQKQRKEELGGDISYYHLQFTGFPNNGIPGLKNGSQGFSIHFREIRAKLKKLDKQSCTYLGTLLDSDIPCAFFWA